jgi:hypothetical protein
MIVVPLPGLEPAHVAWLEQYGPRQVSVGGIFAGELRVVNGSAELTLTVGEEWVERVTLSAGGWVSGWMQEE